MGYLSVVAKSQGEARGKQLRFSFVFRFVFTSQFLSSVKLYVYVFGLLTSL